jgi:hypothetical protein
MATRDLGTVAANLHGLAGAVGHEAQAAVVAAEEAETGEEKRKAG